MEELKAALAETEIKIVGYDTDRARPLRLSSGYVTIKKFSEMLKQALGKKIKSYPDVLYALQDELAMTDMIAEFADSELSATGTGIYIPPELSGRTLNIDVSSNDPGFKKFFCTTEDELRDITMSGQYYITKCGTSPSEVVQSGIARPVIPKYLPRKKKGIHVRHNEITMVPENIFNTYVPPQWELWRRRNPAEWAKLPAKPTTDILKIIQHVIPSKEERNYFYAWLYTSMTSRAFVYLVLCGNPGVGKNRLKLFMRSLHGHYNSSDGKKETMGANQSKFNSQMEENTFIWFDELKYDHEMEPRMKEYQNQDISIEKKGQDTTRSTQIFCSMIISNNYPRDNYILFNSRKFAPLVLGKTALTTAMSPEEINDISQRMDDTHPRFDVKLVAQIAKWILTVGPKYVDKWPNLEYQGPKYWELAHTTMPRWQKIAVLVTTVQNKNGPAPGWDNTKKAFLWSKVEESLRKKKEYGDRDYRDATTVKAFFETYCDKRGQKVFEVEDATVNTLQDFWIKPIHGLIKENVNMTLNDETLDLIERPQGMSKYQWEKLKEKQGKEKDGNEKDEDLL